MDKYFVAKKIAQELDKAQSEYYLLKKTTDSNKEHEKAFLEHIYKLSQLLIMLQKFSFCFTLNRHCLANSCRQVLLFFDNNCLACLSYLLNS